MLLPSYTIVTVTLILFWVTMLFSMENAIVAYIFFNGKSIVSNEFPLLLLYRAKPCLLCWVPTDVGSA